MAEPSTRTVERALHLLGSVCDAGHISLAEAARQTGLSASTALRLLRTLESSGFVRREPETGYRPGMRIVQLGAQALSHESLVSLAMESLRHLVAATGESAYLSVPSVGGTAAKHSIYIAVEEGTHSVRHTSWVGRSVPLEGSAVGTVLRGKTPEEGYVVVDRGVEKDVTAIAAPITVGSGDETRVIAALSVIAPSYRMDAELITRIGHQVAAEAHTILTTHQLDIEAGDDADSKEQTA